MVEKEFYFNCLECFEKKDILEKSVIVVVDNTKDTFNIDKIKGTCTNCKAVWTLAQLGS